MRRVIGLAVVAIVFLSRSNAGVATHAQSNDEYAQFRPKTADQKARAVRFDEPKLQPLTPNTKRIDNLGEQHGPPGPPPDYASFVGRLVCASEMVVVGTPTKQQSFLTQTNSAIFTDYSVAPETFLRGGVTRQQPAADTTLLVSLRGGKILTPLGPLEVENEAPLEIGERYLLFLHRIPNTSSFELSGPHFGVGGGAPRILSRRRLPLALENGDRSTNTLMADIRTAAAACGKGGAK